MRALGLALLVLGGVGGLGAVGWAVRYVSPRQVRRRRRLALLADTDELARIERNLLDTDPRKDRT